MSRLFLLLSISSLVGSWKIRASISGSGKNWSSSISTDLKDALVVNVNGKDSDIKTDSEAVSR